MTRDEFNDMVTVMVLGPIIVLAFVLIFFFGLRGVA